MMNEEPGSSDPVGEQPVGDQPGPNLADSEPPIQTVPDLVPISPAPAVSSDVPPPVGPETPPTTGFEPPAITPSDQAPADQTPPLQSVSPVSPQSTFPTSSDEAPKGFNWGAFWFTWLWGVVHGIWVSILVFPLQFILLIVLSLAASFNILIPSIINAIFHTPLTNAIVWLTWGTSFTLFFVVNLWFGFRGNQWAWNRRKDLGLEAFRNTERVWSIVGWVLSGVPTVLGLAISLIATFTIKPQTTGSDWWCANGGSYKVNGVEQCSTTTSSSSETTPSVSTATETPLGTAAQGGNFAVKVASVNPKPTITGDAPDSGTEYLEIFVTIDNSGKEKDSISAGEFYYQTAAGKELKTADTLGTDSPNKNFNLTGGDERLSVEFLDPGATAANKALIFQIPTGDSGKLVWHEKMFDTSSAKLGIFLLK